LKNGLCSIPYPCTGHEGQGIAVRAKFRVTPVFRRLPMHPAAERQCFEATPVARSNLRAIQRVVILGWKRGAGDHEGVVIRVQPVQNVGTTGRACKSAILQMRLRCPGQSRIQRSARANRDAATPLLRILPHELRVQEKFWEKRETAWHPGEAIRATHHIMCVVILCVWRSRSRER